MNIIGGMDFISEAIDFGASSALNGALGITSAVINGVTYIFASSDSDNGIQVLSLNAAGVLTPTYSIFDSSATGLSDVYSVKTVMSGGNLYLVTASVGDNALSVFRVDTDNQGTDANLSHVTTVFNGGGAEPAALDDPYFMETVQIGAKTFVITAAYSSDTVSVFQLGANGALTATDSVADSEGQNLNLSTAYGLTIEKIGAKTFLFVGSASGDRGISTFEISANGILTNVANLELGGNSQLASMTTITIAGKDYLFVSDVGTSGLVALSISASGALTEADRFVNTAIGYDFSGLKELNIDGVPFLMAASAGNDKILIFSFTAAEGLQVAQQITSSTDLDSVRNIEPITIGTRQFLVVTAYNADQVSVYEIGAGGDALMGTIVDDNMVGQNGDDEMLGRAGNDALFGGAGQDVLSGGIGNDTLYGGTEADALMGGIGSDTLRGGAGADVLIGREGLDTIDYTGSNAAVRINLALSTAAGGHADGDIFTGIESATGSAFNDTLTGSVGNNVLTGAGGVDLLRGAAGDDGLYGGIGNDILFGDAGKDRLFGGIGNDKLTGGDGADTLVGDAGEDTLTGGADQDRLTGGAGRDVFVFINGEGDDIITDFEVALDKIDLSGSTTLNSFADVQAAAITFSGSTIISIDTGSILISGVTEAQLSADNFLF